MFADAVPTGRPRTVPGAASRTVFRLLLRGFLVYVLRTAGYARAAVDNSFSAVLREAFVGTTRLYAGIHHHRPDHLSIPMILEMSMEALFAIVDTFFVAKLGPGPVAVVGLTNRFLRSFMRSVSA